MQNGSYRPIFYANVVSVLKTMVSKRLRRKEPVYICLKTALGTVFITERIHH